VLFGKLIRARPAPWKRPGPCRGSRRGQAQVSEEHLAKLLGELMLKRGRQREDALPNPLQLDGERFESP